ncbi:MAG: hypothetical protein AAB818_02285 [Patescibacteria group bacterium]
MYIRTRKELKFLLEERKKLEKTTNEKIGLWAKEKYGIKDFLAIKEKHMPFLKNKKKSYGFLARQIPSVCIEDVACFVGSKKIGLEPISMSFIQDNFSSANAEKLNRVKIPWSRMTGAGKLIIRYENISTKKIPEIESFVLSNIPTVSNKTLPEFHSELRRKVFGIEHQSLDISEFWADCLKEAGNKPEFVYETGSGKAKKIFLKDISKEMNHKNIRPPASWYYPLYFSCFLDGSMVLLETYENPNGEVYEAKKLFIQTMSIMKEIVGEYPLVLEIPPLLLEMRCVSREIVESKDWLKEINEKVSFNNFGEDGYLCQFFKEISEIILRYRN